MKLVGVGLVGVDLGSEVVVGREGEPMGREVGWLDQRHH
jgi:hypothetical protein